MDNPSIPPIRQRIEGESQAGGEGWKVAGRNFRLDPRIGASLDNLAGRFWLEGEKMEKVKMEISLDYLADKIVKVAEDHMDYYRGDSQEDLYQDILGMLKEELK